MQQFVAIESSSGRVIYVTAKDEEDAYRVVGREIYKMPDPIDTGNVDVELHLIEVQSTETARYLGD